MLGLLRWLGEFSLFIGKVLRSAHKPPYHWREIGRQMDDVGTRSFPLVGVAGAAIGVVLAMQTRSTLARFGAEALIPPMIAISVVRELGPVITALMVAGRIGAGFAAELGSMKVTEQIDAMDVAAIDPIKYLVVTRVIACTLMAPILTIYADFLALTGGYIAASFSMETSLRLYLDASLEIIAFADVFPSVAKTAIFGFLIGVVGCFHGFTAEGGTAGVGKSATSSVVISSLLVILANIVLVKLSLALFE